jgi:hypothetical protein
MIVKKRPLVKLLKLADEAYLEKELPAGRGRPYTYSERSMFKCFIVKTVKHLDDCSGLYHYLEHEANEAIRQEVGFTEQMPHLKTFQRRFAESEGLMRRQVGAIARVLAERGVISVELLSVDGSMCEALGPDWHQSDKRSAHIPDKLRNLDLTAEWGKSGYHGWVYGYKALGICNCGVGEPSVFVDGWVVKANVCETVNVREELERTGLPEGNRVLFGDSGFDDQKLFELCRRAKSLLVVPITAEENSPPERYLKEAVYLDYVNCGMYKRRSLSIEPLWAYIKDLFDLEVMHQHGVFKAGAEVVSAMAAYNLIVLYNHSEGLPLRAVKPFLDVL